MVLDFVSNCVSPDSDRHSLELIIPPCPPAVAGLLDDFVNVLPALTLGHVEFESISELIKHFVLPLEAWQVNSRDNGHLNE